MSFAFESISKCLKESIKFLYSNNSCRRYDDNETFAKCRACGLIFDIAEVGTHASSCKASKSEKKRVGFVSLLFIIISVKEIDLKQFLEEIAMY